MEQQVDRLDTLTKNRTDAQIATLVNTDTIYQLLLSILCIGPLTALVLRAEIGGILLFANAYKLIASAELEPRIIQSCDHCRYGGLTKHGNAYLRNIVVLFSQSTIQSHRDTPFKCRFYHWCHAYHPIMARAERNGKDRREVDQILLSAQRDRAVPNFAPGFASDKIGHLSSNSEYTTTLWCGGIAAYSVVKERCKNY